MTPSPDPSELVAAVEGLHASVVAGIAIVIFVLVAGLIVSFGRRR